MIKTLNEKFPSLLKLPDVCIIHTKGLHKNISESGITVEMSYESLISLLLDKQKVEEAIINEYKGTGDAMTKRQFERLYELLGDMAIKYDTPINWNGGVEI